MSKTIYEKHKKLCLTGICIFTFLFFGIYLSMLFQPGYRHFDAFMKKQDNGIFTGSDFYGSYQMQIERTDHGGTITFSVDDISKEYRITETDAGKNVYIYENDTLVFHGYYIDAGNQEGWLISYDNYDTFDVRIFASNVKPSPEELFPSYSWLYNCTMSDKTETRGEPAALIPIVFLAVFLFLDIKFPDLFFNLKYRLSVDGGEPSDFYRSGQIIGRIIMIGSIFFFIFLSLHPNMIR